MPNQLLLQLRTKNLSQELKLYAKSPALHHFFQKISEGKTTTAEEPALFSGTFFVPAKLPQINYIDFGALSAKELMDSNGIVNGSFLRHTDLDKGISFKIPTLVHDSVWTTIEDYITKGLNELYRSHIRDYERDLSVGVNPETGAIFNNRIRATSQLEFYAGGYTLVTNIPAPTINGTSF